MVSNTTINSRVRTQLRESPLISAADTSLWLSQAIEDFSNKAQWLEDWNIIPCKANVAPYFLPINHQVTILAYYDEVRLYPCTELEAQLVSPGTPIYYYEDEWSDQASHHLSTEFVIHYALQTDLWMIQQAHAQNYQGRKTITLVDVPTADGTVSKYGDAAVGVLDGSITDTTIRWTDRMTGLPVSIVPTTGNLLVFFKCTDETPNNSDDTIYWNDALAVAYTAGACSYGLVTEDDEYDRYRSWVYNNMADAIANSLRSMSINPGIR